jgi:hypothetical protein
MTTGLLFRRVWVWRWGLWNTADKDGIFYYIYYTHSIRMTLTSQYGHINSSFSNSSKDISLSSKKVISKQNLTLSNGELALSL